jgi:zinc transport system substrate-binding protein
MGLICYNIIGTRNFNSQQGDDMRFINPLLFIALGTAAQAGPPKVATDIAPVHGLVAQVMEGVGSPELVIPPGADPHGYAMRPSEAGALAQADIVFWVGPALAPWMAEPIENLAGQARHITLADVDGVTTLAMRADARFEAHDHDDDHGHGHADKHDHAKEHGHDEEHKHDDTHDHGHDDDHAQDHSGQAVDGHMWLDPVIAARWVDEIAQALSEKDPENKSLYVANAEAARAELAVLGERIAEQLSPVSAQPFIVFHDSYQYFERRFGVTAVAAVTMGDSGAASAARLSDVREVVAETGATCALAGPRASQGLIDAVSEGAQITVTRIDAIGVDIPTGPDFYPTLLTQISDGIIACLSGTS